MIAVDTNLLVYAHRGGLPEHRAARAALEQVAASSSGWGIPQTCTAEFWSIVTHPASTGRPSTNSRSLTDPRLPPILKGGYKFLTFFLSMEELHMPLVKVKEKFQVTLPAAIRQKVGVDVGDLLEATVQGKTITFTPKVAVDRAFVEQRLAEGLEDVKKGRVYGPFSSAKALVRSLHHESRKLKKR